MIEATETKQYSDVLAQIIETHGTSRDELIPILHDAHRKIGYLPPEALDEISQILKVSRSHIYSVASFYHMLSLEPRGRHTIKFCESAPCHVAGGAQVLDALKDALNLEAGETSPDGKWTLTTTSCLGVCGVGPVIIIDDDIYGNLEPEQIPEILARYR